MKRTVLFSAVMVAMMSMVSVNAQAQRRGQNNYNAPRQEMRFSDRGGMEMRGGHNQGMNHGYRNEGMNQGMNHGYHNEGAGHYDNRGYYDARPHGHGMMDRREPHMCVDAHGFMPGWEGRVRYLDGRWGYYRDNCWMWYDTYYEPDYYYSRPLRHFRAHYLSPTGRKVVAGVTGAVVLGTLISALAH